MELPTQEEPDTNSIDDIDSITDGNETNDVAENEPSLEDALAEIDALDDDAFLSDFDTLGQTDDVAENNDNDKDQSNTEEDPEDNVDAKDDADTTDATDTDSEDDTNAEDTNDNVDTVSTLDTFTVEQLGKSDEVLKEIFEPFKANGQSIQLSSVEELRSLLSKGADYSKKTAELASQRAVIAKLEEHGLDEDTLNHLIDIKNGNVDAISKLLKDKDISPLSLSDDEDDIDYTPQDYSVDTTQLEFTDTLRELSTTPEYSRLVDTISNSWDNKSQEVLVANPEGLRTIHSHMAEGYYDQIASKVETLRLTGKIAANVPFIEAYKQVGTAMEAAGAFNKKANPKAKPSQTATPANTNEDNTRQVADMRKRAAPTSSAKAKPKARAPSMEQELSDMASMSDEEFMKKYGAL